MYGWLPINQKIPLTLSSVDWAHFGHNHYFPNHASLSTRRSDHTLVYAMEFMSLLLDEGLGLKDITGYRRKENSFRAYSTRLYRSVNSEAHRLPHPAKATKYHFSDV